MASRVQVILDEEERERFRRLAEREGLSLSAWLREAGRERARTAPRKIATRDELVEFFRRCESRESGREPDWEQHKAVIESSARSGATDT